MSSANKTTKEPAKVGEEKIEPASELRAKMFLLLHILRRPFCEMTAKTGLMGWKADGGGGGGGDGGGIAPHIIFWDSADSPRIYLPLGYMCARCQLADFLFLPIFLFFLVAGFSFTWREINLKFKCAPSKMGKNVFDDDDDDDDCVRWRWEHVFLHGKVF